LYEEYKATKLWSTNLELCGESVALMLEFFNNVITFNLSKNPNFVYNILQLEYNFSHLLKFDRFHLLVANMLSVIEYYKERISMVGLEIPTVDEIFQIIESSSLSWNSSRIEYLEPVKFDFEENQDAHKFLIPIVWAMILKI
jgi:hypothetical protein